MRSSITDAAATAGIEVADIRRLKELESENARLEKLLAEAMLGIESLKVVARGKP
jgi:putative transposase